MAMTITDTPLINLDTGEDIAGKEGFAGVISGGKIQLADDGEDAADTMIGVISSVQGNYDDGNQSAALQVTGVAYALLGGAVPAGAPVTCAASGEDADWIEALSGKYAKGFALQTGADTELIQVVLIGTAFSAV